MCHGTTKPASHSEDQAQQKKKTDNSRRQTIASVGKDEPRKLSYNADGNVKWYKLSLENNPTIPQNAKHRVPISPVIPLLGIYPTEMKTCSHKNLYMNVHGIVKNMEANSPYVHQLDNGKTHYGITIEWGYYSVWKAMNYW